VEPVNTGLKAVRRAGIERGQLVLVVGQGPIGLILLQLARREGATVVVSDTLPDRLEAGRRLGAEAALDAARVDVAAEVRAMSDGRGADRTLLAAFGPAAVKQAIDATRPAGRIVIFAATSPGRRWSWIWARWARPRKTWSRRIARPSTSRTKRRASSSAREVRVRELITHRFPLAQAAAAVERAAVPAPGVLKVVLQVS